MARKTPLTADELTRIRTLIDEGVPHREIERTLGHDRKIIAKYFPGTGWTHQEAGALGRAIGRANQAMR
jgi:hypothetical protein